MNKFTLIIHNKGWSVKDACSHWNIHYDTYNARCNNPKMFNQLECMCNGLEDNIENNTPTTYVDRSNGIMTTIRTGLPPLNFKKDKLK